jgi:hypothetical protein
LPFLDSRSRAHRVDAAIALVNMNETAGHEEKIVAALSLALIDDFRATRAIEALVKLRSSARPAIPKLIAVTQGSEVRERRQAVWALGRVGGDDERILPVLIDAAADADHDVRLSALLALHFLQPRARQTVPVIEQAYEEARRKRSFDSSLLNTTNDEEPEDVEALLDLGADANLRGFRTGRTALMVASEKADLETAALLIKRGADVNMKCSVEGVDRVAREQFMRTSRSDFVFFTLARVFGVNIGIGDYKDKTALILAVESEAPEERKLPVVRLLLESGADPEISSKLMHRAKEVAREMGHDQILQLLQEHTRRV